MTPQEQELDEARAEIRSLHGRIVALGNENAQITREYDEVKRRMELAEGKLDALLSVERDDHYTEDQVAIRKLVAETICRSLFNQPSPIEVIEELDKGAEDTARLDKLQRLTKGYGRGWVLRNSATGRGMRLHESSNDEFDAKPNVREAIDNYAEV